MLAIDTAASEQLSLERHIRYVSVRWFRPMRHLLSTCARYYHAAAMYEALRRLPASELERRGFSRGSLARDLCDLDN
jgi:hypothetical protein